MALRCLALAAFAIFFIQSPSFLSFQQNMEKAHGRNNARSLFGVERIPCHNHIRQTLDPACRGPDHSLPQRHLSRHRQPRARWKIENENNNVLKTKGYHLEHNFGHGKKHLSSLLLTMNLLAFSLHTLLEVTDPSYQMVRAAVGARRKFFQHLEAVTAYWFFENWERLMDFMMRGQEVGPYAARKR